MSVRLRMTLWYALLTVLTALLLGALLFWGAMRGVEQYYADTLAAASALAAGEVTEEPSGLEIDDDLEGIPDVHISLYTAGGTLIYGRARFELPFEQGAARAAFTQDGMRWYVLDTLLDFETQGDVWLRCAKAADGQSAAYEPVFRLALVLLPLMLLLAAGGGHLITRRAFAPVARMADTAEAIVSGGDLGRRVGLSGRKRDELSRLSDTLDDMLSRLDAAFQRERQFTSDVSHELRTPLNAIRLLCREAMAEQDARKKNELVAEILERSDALGGLVGRLLELSRMDAGRVEVRMQPVNLTALMRDVARELSPVAADAGISLETAIEEGVSVTGDEALLTRLAANLLSNAIRYGRPGGYARLTLALESGRAVLAVSDNGSGIASGDIPRIWDRFWRADASRHTPGTGLGLSICKWIIERHGARAQVTSALGEGTEIKIAFPL